MGRYTQALYELFKACGTFLFPTSEHEKRVADTTPSELLSLLVATSHHGVVALLPYRHPTVRALVWQLKYRRDARAATLLGEVLVEHIHVYGQPIIIPIPLSPKRYRERGYNQVTLVAEKAASFLPGTTVLSNILTWTREVQHQTMLARHERTENVAGAFCAHPFERNGRTVIILDDVTTTGSTLQSAANALADIGIDDAVLVALAH